MTLAAAITIGARRRWQAAADERGHRQEQCMQQTPDIVRHPQHPERAP
jgi:hypothetical protein